MSVDGGKRSRAGPSSYSLPKAPTCALRMFRRCKRRSSRRSNWQENSYCSLFGERSQRHRDLRDSSALHTSVPPNNNLALSAKHTMAPRDITNCVRRPAPPKQITPTAPRRAVTKAPADDCALTAIVTPDGRTSAWRGDPATHLPEEVFHLVLALAGGRACVGAASVRRAWRLATATTLDALPPFASSTNYTRVELAKC